MLGEEEFQKVFLEEKQALDDFRVQHSSRFEETPLEHLKDPYTSSLIEALAFFGARASWEGAKRVSTIHQELFRQYFPYLVNPLPAMGMIQLSPSMHRPDPTPIPRGTEIGLMGKGGRRFVFQTLEPTMIYPLSPGPFSFEKCGEGRRELCITYTSREPISTPISAFSLFIHHLSDFRSSVRVSFALQRALIGATIRFKEKEPPVPCKLHFGCPKGREIFAHPVERVRTLLHAPEQDLFVNVTFPERVEKWTELTISLQLDEKWPGKLMLGDTSFLPFVVPIANLSRATAEPILCDGKRDSYVIMHPKSIGDFSLHTVKLVSKTEPGGSKILRPGILGQKQDSYEVDYFNERMTLNIENAFRDPRTVQVEALWTQPWINDFIDYGFQLSILNEQLEGIPLKELGEIRPFENPLDSEDPNLLVRVLGLKNQDVLTKEEILFLLDILKAISRSEFAAIPESIREVKINRVRSRSQVGQTIQFVFELMESSSSKWELSVLFFKNLHNLLNCWLSNYDVETKVLYPSHLKPLIINKGVTDELSTLARDFFIS